MGKGPKAPDPYAQAAAQQGAELGASMGSSIINNPNVVTPYGSQSYKIAGYETIYDAQGKPMQVPRYTQTQTLSPAQQQLLNYSNQMQANLGQTGVEQSAKLHKLLGTSVDTQGLQGWNAGPQAAQLATTFGGQGDLRQDQAPTDRAAIEQAMMGRYNTDAARQNAAQEAQLAARGMNVGSSQYGTVAEQQGRQRADALQQAYLGSGQESRAAQQAYNQAQAQRFQEAATRGEFGNAALMNQFQMGGSAADRANALRQAQWGERLSERNQPLNEISALLSGAQVTMPQFNPYSAQGINAAPVGQYMGQNYTNELQASNAQNAGLFGLGGSALSAFGQMGGLAGILPFI